MVAREIVCFFMEKVWAYGFLGLIHSITTTSKRIYEFAPA